MARISSDIYRVGSHNRRAAKPSLWMESAAEEEDLAAFGITREQAENLTRSVAFTYQIVSDKGRRPDSVIYAATHNEFSIIIRNRMRRCEEAIHLTREDINRLHGSTLEAREFMAARPSVE